MGWQNEFNEAWERKKDVIGKGTPEQIARAWYTNGRVVESLCAVEILVELKVLKRRLDEARLNSSAANEVILAETEDRKQLRDEIARLQGERDAAIAQRNNATATYIRLMETGVCGRHVNVPLNDFIAAQRGAGCAQCQQERAGDLQRQLDEAERQIVALEAENTRLRGV